MPSSDSCPQSTVSSTMGQRREENSFSSFFLSRYSFSYVDKGLLSKKEPFTPLAFVLIIWASIFISSFLFTRSTAPSRSHRDTYFFRFGYSMGIL
nr:hypothetical protein [Listeria booriae]